MSSSTSTSTLWSQQTPIPRTQFGMSSTPAPAPNPTVFGSYGTRRASAMAINSSASPTVTGSHLPTGSSPGFGSPATSSSVKKGTQAPKLKARRLSSSSTAMRSPHIGPGLGLSASVPANAHQAHAIANARARGATKSEALYGSPSLGLGMVGLGEEDELEEGELRGADREGAGTIYECEKCKKAYKHERCLVKHRWEHTAHWKSSSHLLLSKHQQVQLLEAAAILKAVQAGASLPDEKSFWPAAVSPPQSGLLGSSPNINIHALTLNSPRLSASRSLHPDNSYRASSSYVSSSLHRQDEYEPELEGEREEGSSPGAEDDEDTGESVSTGDDPLVESMFEMELEEEGMGMGRGRSAEADSGFGSVGSTNGAKGPQMGYF